MPEVHFVPNFQTSQLANRPLKKRKNVSCCLGCACNDATLSPSTPILRNTCAATVDDHGMRLLGHGGHAELLGRLAAMPLLALQRQATHMSCELSLLQYPCFVWLGAECACSLACVQYVQLCMYVVPCTVWDCT